MTIRDLMNQFTIQGAYCIKVWNDDFEFYEKLAEGKDFEGDILNVYISQKYLDAEIAYMYAENGMLNFEVEL